MFFCEENRPTVATSIGLLSFLLLIDEEAERFPPLVWLHVPPVAATRAALAVASSRIEVCEA